MFTLTPYWISVGSSRILAWAAIARQPAEFQKVLDHPGITLNDPIGSMARLEPARALSECDDSAKAGSVYWTLLTIWQDGNSYMPLVEQTMAENAELK